MNEKKREPARWIFAKELRNTSLTTLEGDEENKKEYFITQGGSVGRRILFCGKITQKNGEGDMIKMVVADLTGAFYLTFFPKDFNQETKLQIDKVKENDEVMVIGRTSYFKSPEGKFFININPESVRTVEESDSEYWKTQSLSYLKRRITILHELQKSPDLTEDQLVAMGFNQEEAEGCKKAIEAYERPNIGPLEELLLASDTNNVSEAALVLKEQVLNLVKENGLIGGITYQEILDQLSSKGIDSKQLDEILNLLGSDGEIYESEKRKFRPV